MIKIGRNDPCPCMSGKKYKNCCDKTKIWGFFKEQGLNYFNESFIIGDIYVNDEKFRHFYNSQRRLINKDLFFIQRENIGASASFGHIPELAYTILVTEEKISLKNSIHVAHEIEHLVLCSLGYKIAKFKDEHLNRVSRTHKMINDMIYDPIVNKTLIKYGFDLNSYLELADQVQLNTIGNSEGDQFLAMTLYVKRYFDFKNLNNDISPEEILFNKWVSKNFPHLVETSKLIIKLICDNGIGSPNEVENTLNKIITFLDLEDKITLNLL